jgi:hypothetical protein
MSTTSLKKELHKAIDEMPDSVFLEAINSLFRQYKKNSNSIEFELSDEDKAILDEQKKLHKAGKSKSYSLSEVRKNAISRLGR